MTRFIKHKAVLFAVGAIVATPLAACSSGGDDDAASDDATTTTTTIVVPDNFFEDPLKVEAIVDRLVDAETPIVTLAFTQDSLSLQERGRPDTFVVYEAVGPDDLGPTTTAPDPDAEDGEVPSAVPSERGVTVQRVEMTPEEYDALSAELAAIDERNAGVVSEEAVAPIAGEAQYEPYRFGPDRVDMWTYNGKTRVASRSPTAVDSDAIEKLDGLTFSIASIDWAAFQPLMRALLAELDLGDSEKIKSVSINRRTDGPPEDIMVTMSAEGERGKGTLLVSGGEVSITRN